eukprot:m.251431 g.251431  ORF g.251431 m.251431 type:complete len:742 (+) comp26695_c0_seq23:432-2657(+)
MYDENTPEAHVEIFYKQLFRHNNMNYKTVREYVNDQRRLHDNSVRGYGPDIDFLFHSPHYFSPYQHEFFGEVFPRMATDHLLLHGFGAPVPGQLGLMYPELASLITHFDDLPQPNPPSFVPPRAVASEMSAQAAKRRRTEHENEQPTPRQSNIVSPRNVQPSTTNRSSYSIPSSQTPAHSFLSPNSVLSLNHNSQPTSATLPPPLTSSEQPLFAAFPPQPSSSSSSSAPGAPQPEQPHIASPPPQPCSSSSSSASISVPALSACPAPQPSSSSSSSSHELTTDLTKFSFLNLMSEKVTLQVTLADSPLNQFLSIPLNEFNRKPADLQVTGFVVEKVAQTAKGNKFDLKLHGHKYSYLPSVEISPLNQIFLVTLAKEGGPSRYIILRPTNANDNRRLNRQLFKCCRACNQCNPNADLVCRLCGAAFECKTAKPRLQRVGSEALFQLVDDPSIPQSKSAVSMLHNALYKTHQLCIKKHWQASLVLTNGRHTSAILIDPDAHQTPHLRSCALVCSDQNLLPSNMFKEIETPTVSTLDQRLVAELMNNWHVVPISDVPNHVENILKWVAHQMMLVGRCDERRAGKKGGRGSSQMFHVSIEDLKKAARDGFDELRNSGDADLFCRLENISPTLFDLNRPLEKVTRGFLALALDQYSFELTFSTVDGVGWLSTNALNPQQQTILRTTNSADTNKFKRIYRRTLSHSGLAVHVALLPLQDNPNEFRWVGLTMKNQAILDVNPNRPTAS